MSPRTAGLLAAGAVAAAVGAATPAAPPPAASPSPTQVSAEEQVVRQACTPCHALPPPDILPRDQWTAKIYEMAGLMMSGIGAPPGGKATIPADFDVDAVERYYKSRAPVALPTPVPWPPVG